VTAGSLHPGVVSIHAIGGMAGVGKTRAGGPCPAPDRAAVPRRAGASLTVAMVDRSYGMTMPTGGDPATRTKPRTNDPRLPRTEPDVRGH
jgi:hypothetical protein